MDSTAVAVVTASKYCLLTVLTMLRARLGAYYYSDTSRFGQQAFKMKGFNMMKSAWATDMVP